MTLTVLLRENSAYPECTFTDVLSIRSDGTYLNVQQRHYDRDLRPVLLHWPLLLTDIAEVRLSEP